MFTRKVTTDVSYLACAGRLFKHIEVIYPQFATHNAHSIAAILQLAPAGANYEFQRLHGMGRLLYAEAARQVADFPRVRVYAPVGEHKDLLAYLVRRLLENGANTSFVNRFMDEQVPVAEIVLGKQRILELYLNVVEWGPGIYGADAACHYWDHTAADHVGREQAARLAAILPAPLKRKPEKMNHYSDLILERMRQMGW